MNLRKSTVIVENIIKDIETKFKAPDNSGMSKKRLISRESYIRKVSRANKIKVGYIRRVMKIKAI